MNYYKTPDAGLAWWLIEPIQYSFASLVLIKKAAQAAPAALAAAAAALALLGAGLLGTQAWGRAAAVRGLGVSKIGKIIISKN